MPKYAYYTFSQFNRRIFRIGYEHNNITSASIVTHIDTPNEPSNVSDAAFQQLSEYFNKERQVFDLPLAPQGTAFQQRVWRALQQIPYGQTRSYKDIALAINNPKAYRAVGMANNKNPLMIFIPCHRVIGSNHRLVGYAGGLDIKEELLALENPLTLHRLK